MNDRVLKFPFFKSSISLWFGLLFFGFGVISLSLSIIAKANQEPDATSMSVELMLVGVFLNSIMVAGTIFALLIHYGKIGPYQQPPSD
jgi:hypothetical protein